MSEKEQIQQDGVAVIGMAGRFPGADSVEELWSNLCRGEESISFFNREELDPEIPEAISSAPNYIPARGVMRDADKFDATFFGVQPREAELMDPQQRVFLEMAWSALENAGHHPDSIEGLIGVYAGMANNTYFPNLIAGREELINTIGGFQTMLANEKDFLATRISHKLNLTGPSLSIYTGCSTSLVAVTEAFHHLMSYRCDMALAGGVTITVPQESGYLSQDGGIESGDGHCRPFDEKASGTVFSNGAGLVVLRRLEDALEDGDRVLAVLRGAALNNDGATKVSFAAPSVDGQAQVIAMAHAQAGIEAESISYVETHGTGTRLGDLIEIEALTQAFRESTEAKQFCAVGSVKSNFGHLLAAAGVTGLIKTVLALYHKKLPPTLHFNETNPEIKLAESPFYVNVSLKDWGERSTPRRAGVSSFGIGGTNAHVVLEEAPVMDDSGPSRSVQIVTLSAKTDQALIRMKTRLKESLENNQLSPADVAFTLNHGRRSFSRRSMVFCPEGRDLSTAVEKMISNPASTNTVEHPDPPLVFMFPGQGSQYPAMGRDLYAREQRFREVIDHGSDIVKPCVGYDVAERYFRNLPSPETEAAVMDDAAVTQILLFLVDLALAELWISWGVRPSFLIGHGLGEWVAATLAGVFALEDALRLTVERGRLVSELPRVSMLSVLQDPDELRSWLPEGVELAAVNSATLCVVSGPGDKVKELAARCEKGGVVCHALPSSHAVHSAMMEPVVTELLSLLGSVSMAAPVLPLVSAVSGEPLSDEEATDPATWARQLQRMVNFAKGVDFLAGVEHAIWLEAGPGNSCATFARQSLQKAGKNPVFSSFGDPVADKEVREQDRVVETLGSLWLKGAPVDWNSFYAGEKRRKVALPTYPFEKTRTWVDLSGSAAIRDLPTRDPAQEEMAGGRVIERALEAPLANLDSNEHENVDELRSSVLKRIEKKRKARAKQPSVTKD